MDPDTPVALVVEAGCVTTGGQVVVRARAFLFGDPRPAAYVAAQTFAAPAGGATVAIDLPAWQTETATFALALTGIPAEATTARSDVTVFHDGIQFDTLTIDTTELVGPAVDHVYEYWPGVATRLQWRPAIRLPDNVQMLVRSSAVPPPADDLADFAGDTLPAISGVTGSIGDAGAPALDWQGSVVADGLVGMAQWDYADQARARWTALAPADGAQTLTFPALPDSLAAVRAAVATEVTSTVFLMEGDNITDYAQFRQGAGQDLLDPPPPAGEFRARVSASGLLAL
jgi:hypothetical protein